MIALQKPVRPATGGEPAGAPFFYIRGDGAYAKVILKQTSYYSLISGYKDIFKNPTTKKYKDGTRFEDIVELYYFDELLRQLFLRYLIKVYPLSDGMSAEEIEEMISYYVQAKIIEIDHCNDIVI